MRRRGIGRPAQPSLVSTAARTAVIAGTATAVSGKVAANQAAKAQQAAAPPVEAPSPVQTRGRTSDPRPADQPPFSDDVYEQLKKLGELSEAGILTDEEFQAKKAQILGQRC
jgi:hypothetical protein